MSLVFPLIYVLVFHLLPLSSVLVSFLCSLLSVLVTPLYSHQPWCGHSSVICPGVHWVPSSNCPGYLSVLSVISPSVPTSLLSVLVSLSPVLVPALLSPSSALVSLLFFVPLVQMFTIFFYCRPGVPTVSLSSVLLFHLFSVSSVLVSPLFSLSSTTGVHYTWTAGAHFHLDWNRTNILDNTNSIGHLSWKPNNNRTFLSCSLEQHVLNGKFSAVTENNTQSNSSTIHIGLKSN